MSVPGMSSVARYAGVVRLVVHPPKNGPFSAFRHLWSTPLNCENAVDGGCTTRHSNGYRAYRAVSPTGDTPSDLRKHRNPLAVPRDTLYHENDQALTCGNKPYHPYHPVGVCVRIRTRTHTPTNTGSPQPPQDTTPRKPAANTTQTPPPKTIGTHSRTTIQPTNSNTRTAQRRDNPGRAITRGEGMPFL